MDRVFRELAAAVNEALVPGTTAKVSAFNWAPEAISPPHFEVAEFQITYHRTMATEAKPFGDSQVQITCNLLLSRGDDESGQVEAQRLSGAATDTVIAALEAARGAPGQSALNGAIDDFYVTSARGPRLIDYGTVKYYGIEFSLFAYGDGDQEA